jgi:hypothetical protein
MAQPQRPGVYVVTRAFGLAMDDVDPAGDEWLRCKGSSLT